MSLDSKTSEKRIRNWFVSARQRIGWTKILKEHFHSDKTDASEAAEYVFNQTHVSTPINQSIVRKFVKMQLAVEDMYAATFKPTQFMGNLSVTVVDMSPEHKMMLEQMRGEAIEEENIQRKMEHRLKIQKAAQRRASQRRSLSLYPSPEPTSSLSDIEDTEAELSNSTFAAGRKRRRSSSPNEPAKRNKRARYITSRTLNIHSRFVL